MERAAGQALARKLSTEDLADELMQPGAVRRGERGRPGWAAGRSDQAGAGGDAGRRDDRPRRLRAARSGWASLGQLAQRDAGQDGAHRDRPGRDRRASGSGGDVRADGGAQASPAPRRGRSDGAVVVGQGADPWRDQRPSGGDLPGQGVQGDGPADHRSGPRDDGGVAEPGVPRTERRRDVEDRVLWFGAVSEREVWPSAAALQGEAANHRKLRRSRAGVVSVAGNGGLSVRQVRIEKASESEPSMTCRNAKGGIRTGAHGSLREESGSYLLTAQVVPGMEVAQARSRLRYGTWEPVAPIPTAVVWTCRVLRPREGGPQAAITARGRVPMRGTGADRLVVAGRLGNASGAKETGHPGLLGGQPLSDGRSW